MQKKFRVISIDAWWHDNEWIYNNILPCGMVYITGNPSKTKILNALKRNNYLPQKVENTQYDVDDGRIYDAVICVMQADDYMPLYELVEIT